MFVRYIGETKPLELTHDRIYETVKIKNGGYLVINEKDEEQLYPNQLFEICDKEGRPEYGLEMLRMLMEKDFSEATITTAVGICRHKSKEPAKAFKAVRDYLIENQNAEEKVVWRYLQDEVRGKY